MMYTQAELEYIENRKITNLCVLKWKAENPGGHYPSMSWGSERDMQNYFAGLAGFSSHGAAKEYFTAISDAEEAKIREEAEKFEGRSLPREESLKATQDLMRERYGTDLPSNVADSFDAISTRLERENAKEPGGANGIAGGIVLVGAVILAVLYALFGRK